jgi:hypothetical protein
MIDKFTRLIAIISFLTINVHVVAADDVADAESISEAAGVSARAAATQMTEDVSKVTQNISMLLQD